VRLPEGRNHVLAHRKTFGRRVTLTIRTAGLPAAITEQLVGNTDERTHRGYTRPIEGTEGLIRDTSTRTSGVRSAPPEYHRGRHRRPMNTKRPACAGLFLMDLTGHLSNPPEALANLLSILSQPSPGANS